MEHNNLDHVMHSALLGFLLYFGMVHLLKIDKNKACSRSVVIAGLALVYMVMFGHKVPSNANLNPALKF